MNRVAPFLTVRRLCGLLGVAVVLGCMGGTGTDTENGLGINVNARVMDSEGRPLSGVEIIVHSADFRPDADPRENLFVDTGALRTNFLGVSNLAFLDTGHYVVEGRWVGMSVFFDTISVKLTDNKSLRVFTPHAPSPVSGKVQLLSGFRIDTGLVFLRGTGRLSTIHKDGSYDFGLLPPDAFSLAIGVRFTARPRDTSYVLVGSDSCLDTLPVRTSGTVGDTTTPSDSIMANAARLACGTQTGGIIIVQTADSSGPLLGSTPRDYIIPDTIHIDINGGVTTISAPASLPAICVPTAGDRLSWENYLLSATGELRVNDVSSTLPGCSAP